MGKAARNARKRQQRADGVKYQHPTRDGIPYGRSKQPNLLSQLPSREEIMRTKALMEVARDWWPR